MRSIWHEMFKIASVEELTTPPRPLVGIGASCLRQSQLLAFGACNFPDSHVYMRKTLIFPAQSPPTRHLQRLDFFTYNMSHHLKSLKICPAQRGWLARP